MGAARLSSSSGGPAVCEWGTLSVSRWDVFSRPVGLDAVILWSCLQILSVSMLLVPSDLDRHAASGWRCGHGLGL